MLFQATKLDGNKGSEEPQKWEELQGLSSGLLPVCHT